MTDREFPYRMHPLAALLAIVFFGACLGLFVWLAATNEVGLILNGVIELGPTGATIFYVVLGVLSGGFVVAGLLGLVAPEHTLLIGADQATIPCGPMLRKQTVVRFAEVSRVTVSEAQGTRLFTLHHPGGKTSVSNRFLKGRGTFKEVTRLLEERIRGHR